MRVFVMPYGHEVVVPDDCDIDRVPFANQLAFRRRGTTTPIAIFNPDHIIYMLPDEAP